MSNLQVDSVLAQIRALSAQIKPAAHPTSPAATTETGNSFASMMTQGLNQVNQLQQDANNTATAFQRGERGVELSDVMISLQKSSVAFRAATEVRNRMVSAYQDIMNMQV